MESLIHIMETLKHCVGSPMHDITLKQNVDLSCIIGNLVKNDMGLLIQNTKALTHYVESLGEMMSN